MKEATAEVFRRMSRTESPYLFCCRKARISGPPGAVVAVLLLTLGACSGSDFKKLGSDVGDHVAKELFGVDLSGSEGPEEQKARARDFARRADTLVATGAYAGSSPVATATCTRARCLWTGGGAPPARTISDLFPADISGVAKGATHDGATDFQYRSGDRKTYGYWMTHSVFGVAEEPGQPIARFGFAGGDLTGSRPPASATWTGRMVGTAVEGAAAGTRLAGDATLSWSAAAGTIDVAIDNIRDNADGNAWSVGAVRFDDVPVSADGTFGFGASGDIIRGGFHGPNHAEAAGAFEKRGIVGGFGAGQE